MYDSKTKCLTWVKALLFISRTPILTIQKEEDADGLEQIEVKEAGQR